MDGFAGFPIRSSTPRGSAFVEFTRGNQAAAAAPPKPQPALPAPPTRQESLSVLRGGERVSRETMEAGDQTGAPDGENEPLLSDGKAEQPSEEGAPPPERADSWSKAVTDRFVAAHGLTPSAYIAMTGDRVTTDGTIEGVK